MTVAIVGLGYVGTAMLGMFPDALKHDPAKNHLANTRDIEACDLVIVCVPTPKGDSGQCDTSIVESAIAALPDNVLIMLKSTVPPGTTDKLSKGRRIVFSPEYIGEGGYWTPSHFPHPKDSKSHGFVILGGKPEDCSAVADVLLPVLGPSTRYRFMSAIEAETVKYMENAYLAMKVMFCNETRRICDGLQANYHIVREGWLDDPRIGTSHSAAFKQKPGFDGKCLPKDLAAIRYHCQSHGIATPLLDAVAKANTR